MGTPDPRHTLRTEWPEVRIWARWMPDRYGLTTWTEKGPVIELACDLGPEQQALTLAHELAHLELGEPCESYCTANEAEAVAWAAKFLLPDVTVLGKLLARMDVEAAAAKLGVPADAVLDRLASMSPAETDTIASHLKAATSPKGRMTASPRRGSAPPHRCGRTRGRTN